MYGAGVRDIGVFEKKFGTFDYFSKLKKYRNNLSPLFRTSHHTAPVLARQNNFNFINFGTNQSLIKSHSLVHSLRQLQKLLLARRLGRVAGMIYHTNRPLRRWSAQLIRRRLDRYFHVKVDFWPTGDGGCQGGFWPITRHV